MNARDMGGNAVVGVDVELATAHEIPIIIVIGTGVGLAKQNEESDSQMVSASMGERTSPQSQKRLSSSTCLQTVHQPGKRHARELLEEPHKADYEARLLILSALQEKIDRSRKPSRPSGTRSRCSLPLPS